MNQVTRGILTDQRHFASVVYRGGPVYTANPANETASAVALRGDRILAVGDVSDILHLVGPATEVVDLAGNSILPGLIDAHSHITGHGQDLAALDCKHGVSSIADIVAKVRSVAAGLPPGAWIVGRGYDQKKLTEGRHPERSDLDAATTVHPVVLTRTCGHIIACNSLALSLAGITAAIPDPVGGAIARDARGVPTGILMESACAPVRALLVPELAELRDAYIAACRDYVAHGITSSHDASGYSPDQIRTMVEAHLSGAAALRTYMMLRFGVAGSAGDAAMAAGTISRLGGHDIRIGPLKVMVDGSSSGPTAATRRPYASQPDSSGILYFTGAQLDGLVAAGARAGFQVTSHCVGDRAVEMMLHAFAASEPDPSGRRHRIEHCAMLDPDLVQEILRLGVIPVANPCFLWEFGDGYVRDYGPERAAWMFPLRSLLDAGIPVAAGSDAPVTYVNPFLGIYCAMTRRTMRGTVVGPEQAISFADALRIYTVNGARASYEEDAKGSIEPGKLADLTIIEGDPSRMTPEQIKDIKVLQTVIGGRVVYQG